MWAWAIIGWILLGLLGLLLFLLVCPVFFRISYHGELTARMYVLGIPFTLASPSKALKKEKKASRSGKKQKSFKKDSQKGDKKKAQPSVVDMLKEDGPGAVIAYFAAISHLASTALRRLLAALRISRFEVEILLASADAAKTAQNVGRACGVVYPAEAVLQRLTHMKRHRVTVAPDFLSEKGRVDMEIRLHVVPLQGGWVLLRLLWGYLMLNLRDQGQGGDKAEPIKEAVSAAGK